MPSPEESSEEFYESQLISFKNSFPDYTLSEEPTSANLNGNNAPQAKFDSMNNNINCKTMEFWTTNQDRNRAYQIEIGVLADKFPLFPPEHIQR